MRANDPLPIPVVWHKEALSAQAREEIRRLTKRAPAQFLVQLGMAWAVIVIAIWSAVTCHSVWVSAIAIFIIATRQNILGLLVHEQAHCLGFKARWGDLFVDLVAAYPLLVLTVEGYAQVHLSHHRFYFTEKDPDFLRKSGEQWTMPVRAGRLVKLFVTDLFGLNVLKLIKGKTLTRAVVFPRPAISAKWIRFAYYFLAAVGITVVGGWSIFLVYWVVPLLTVGQILVRLGAISEHKYNLPNATVEESSPLIIPTWWEKLLIPNLNFTLHPYHHFYPGVAFCNLPKIHRIFQREGFVNETNVFHGYFPFLKLLVSTEHSGSSVTS